MANFLLSNIKMLPPGHAHSHRVVILGGVIISFFVIILAFLVANSRSSFFGRASSTSSARISGSLSLENSYLFASPISAAADSSSVIRATVILLNDQGLGVSNEKVNLRLSGVGPLVNPIQPVTDTFGRAIFDLSSNVPGSYTISAELSGGSLPQTVSVVFR